MEWCQIVISVINGAFWVVPLVLIVAFLAFLVLAPLVATARGVLYTFNIILGKPGRMSHVETQLSTGLPMDMEPRVAA